MHLHMPDTLWFCIRSAKPLRYKIEQNLSATPRIPFRPILNRLLIDKYSNRILCLDGTGLSRLKGENGFFRTLLWPRTTTNFHFEGGVGNKHFLRNQAKNRFLKSISFSTNIVCGGRGYCGITSKMNWTLTLNRHIYVFVLNYTNLCAESVEALSNVMHAKMIV